MVDPAYGVEPIKRCWRLNTNLPIQVILQVKQKAIQEVAKSWPGITLWTDGSKLDTRNVGAAVIWFDIRLNKWQKKRRYLGENKDLFNAELWAISDALELGIKKTRNGNPTMITIFTDIQATIAKIFNSKARSGGDSIRAFIYENVHEIKSSGSQVTQRYLKTKGLMQVQKTLRTKEEDSSSLIFIKTKLQKTRSAELLL